MADTPQTGETVNPGDSQTTVPTPAAQPAPAAQANASDPAEVERLRKEKEQADLRIRQLENEKKAREEADAEAERKRLESQQEWQQIAEQEREKREALERDQQEAETKQALKFAEDTIFAEFSPEAIEVAKEAGLSLTEDSDEAKNLFKEKLQKISDKVVTRQTVTPNNPAPTQETSDRAQLVEKMRFGDKEARDKVIRELPVLDVMRKQAGYTPSQQ